MFINKYKADVEQNQNNDPACSIIFGTRFLFERSPQLNMLGKQQKFARFPQSYFTVLQQKLYDRAAGIPELLARKQFFSSTTFLPICNFGLLSYSDIAHCKYLSWERSLEGMIPANYFKYLYSHIDKNKRFTS